MSSLSGHYEKPDYYGPEIKSSYPFQISVYSRFQFCFRHSVNLKMNKDNFNMRQKNTRF